MDAKGSFFEGIEKVYSSFFLRDLLGFALPGFFALASVLYLTESPRVTPFLSWLLGLVPFHISLWHALLVGGASYLAGLMLQGIHFTVLEACVLATRLLVGGVALMASNGDSDRREVIRGWVRDRFAWLPPVRLLWLYDHAVDLIGARGEQTNSRLSVSRMVLALDAIVASELGAEGSKRVERSLSYNERVGVLTVVRGNLAVASVPVCYALAVQGQPVWNLAAEILLAVALMNYWEMWRTWLFRVERMSLYVFGADAAWFERTR